MATALQLREKLLRFKVKTEVKVAILKTQSYIIELNKSQLGHGQNKYGRKIKPTYAAKWYAEYKYSLNPVPGKWTPDLFLTGSFYDHIKFTLGEDDFRLFSTDKKNDELEAKYPVIFGMTPGNTETYAYTMFLPVLARQIESQTGLKLEL